MVTWQRIKHYLWVNKEGAIVGGILVATWWFYIASGMNVNGFKPGIEVFISYLNGTHTTDMAGNLATFILYSSVAIGAIIGAFIDSVWRKNK